MSKTILITGAAGFIGFHVSKVLLERGHKVIGLDNINDYYDVNLKLARLEVLGIDRNEALQELNFTSSTIYGTRMIFVRMNLEDRNALPKLFEAYKIDVGLLINFGAPSLQFKRLTIEKKLNKMI